MDQVEVKRLHHVHGMSAWEISRATNETVDGIMADLEESEGVCAVCGLPGVLTPVTILTPEQPPTELLVHRATAPFIPFMLARYAK